MFDLAIDRIVVGNRQRKNIGDLTGLCSSIETVGLLHPVVLDANHKLIAGARRLAAFKKLGRTKIPSVIANNLEDARLHLIAERDENICRLDFSPFEAVAMGRALEELERPKAKERMKQKPGGKQGEKVCSGNFPEEKSETREKVGAAIGMSGPTYQRAKAVVAAAEKEPDKFGAIAEEMERTGKVHPAYDKLKQAQGKVGPNEQKRRKRGGGANASALSIKASIASLEHLIQTLERIGVASRVAKHTDAIKEEIENVNCNT